jgi:hypothetical protein
MVAMAAMAIYKLYHFFPKWQLQSGKVKGIISLRFSMTLDR